MALSEDEFQSLFFWMMPTGEIPTMIDIAHLEVSILVLLDDAYRPRFCLNFSSSSSQFQSLFFWMMPTGLSGTLTLPE